MQVSAMMRKLVWPADQRVSFATREQIRCKSVACLSAVSLQNSRDLNSRDRHGMINMRGVSICPPSHLLSSFSLARRIENRESRIEGKFL
jgi:hypothetical protein